MRLRAASGGGSEDDGGLEGTVRLWASTPAGDGGEVGRRRIGETAARARDDLGKNWWPRGGVGGKPLFK